MLRFKVINNHLLPSQRSRDSDTQKIQVFNPPQGSLQKKTRHRTTVFARIFDIARAVINLAFAEPEERSATKSNSIT
jgi:hypothetical protein